MFQIDTAQVHYGYDVMERFTAAMERFKADVANMRGRGLAQKDSHEKNTRFLRISIFQVANMSVYLVLSPASELFVSSEGE